MPLVVRRGHTIPAIPPAPTRRWVHAREGVAHLWLVDPADRILEAFELRGPVSIRPFDVIIFSLAELWLMIDTCSRS